MGVGVLFESVRTLMWHRKLPNVNIQIDPFATLVPKCQYSDRSICNIGTQMSIFRSIHLQHWYPNVNIRLDPLATLVPKLPNVNTQIDPFATLVPQIPNVNTQIDPFATLVTKCQYSDRIHSQSVWLGSQSEYNTFGWRRNPYAHP